MTQPRQFDHERRLIENFFQAMMNDTETEFIKVKYENQAFTMPTTETWAALTIVTAEGNKIDLRENALHRYGGIVIVQVFQKERTGTGAARELAGRVAEIFREQELCDDALECGLIRFRTPAVLTIGLVNGWYQMNVNCPYIRDVNHQLPS